MSSLSWGDTRMMQDSHLSEKAEAARGSRIEVLHPNQSVPQTLLGLEVQECFLWTEVGEKQLSSDILKPAQENDC